MSDTTPTTNMALVTTIGERCRTCYTCVRECPAKAIRIADGQAEVLHERCIGCGNCVNVCSQGAKQVLSSLAEVEELLAGTDTVAAAVAPSFPAEYRDVDERQFVGMLRDMGFDIVHEVGFGADLVAEATRRVLDEATSQRWMSSACPAIVTYVQKYHPDLCGSLLPLVSPMEASARALRELHGEDLKIVFIGPCLAKKGEAARTSGSGRVDAALTFAELNGLIQLMGLDGRISAPADFDAPRSDLGAVFPLSRGMVQAAGMSEDLTSGRVVTADGRQDFPEAIREFETGDLDADLLDILCCNGCIMGAGMTTTEPLFRRRARISRHVSQRLAEADRGEWQRFMDRLIDLPLDRAFTPEDRRMGEPSEVEIRQIMERMGKRQNTDELNCRACGYDTCRMHAVAIFKGLAESEMCLPYVIDELRSTVGELNESHEELADTQDQLMHSERLASMGQLAAGIAHEVNNPLGVVLLYTHLLRDNCDPDSEEARDLALIADQAERCKGIVAGLLDFARQNKVELEAVTLGDLVDSALRSCLIPENVQVDIHHESADLTAELDRNQLAQVLANLVNNAVAAMPHGGGISIDTGTHGVDSVEVVVKDNGTGISDANRSKIFEPFFTTKERGQGTGLGLAVSYGIVKMHRGDLRFETNADAATGPTGTTFTIVLPGGSRNGGHDPAADKG